MTIDFGGIKNYNPDRGFGFVGRTFLNPDGKVFFHIKKIRIKYPELAQKLDSREPFETVNLWYEIETTEKGDQVNKLWLNADNILQSYTHELPGLIEKVESIWKNVASPKPSWLDRVTTELVGVDRRDELSVERDNLESQLRAAEEERRREAEAKALRDNLESQRRAAEEKRRREAEPENEIARLAEKYGLDITETTELLYLLAEMPPFKFKDSKEILAYIVKHVGKLAEKYGLRITEASQLYRLLMEMRPLKFTCSSQLSTYIVKDQPGSRYPKISGIAIMEDGGTRWLFPGGFPQRIYKIICRELGLTSQGTSARVTGFESFEYINSRNQE